jgi:D-sedoheptulose 7-phosphate isomerase
MRDKIVRDIEESIRVKNAILRDCVPLIEELAKLIERALQAGNKIIFFGNGGSASDSQHLAAEFVGRYEKERRALPAIAFTTDTSILTAVGNDYGFEQVFERQIDALARPGDVIVGLSTSGNSPNVIRALDKAKKKGLTTVGFTGKDGGRMKSLVDLAIVVPSQKTSRIQESHILIGHIVCERVDELLSES